MTYETRNKISLFRHIFLSFSKTFGAEKANSETQVSSNSPISTRNSVMRRLPPHNKGSESGSSSGASTSRSSSPSASSSKSSGSPRVTLRLNQLKHRANEESSSKKNKINLSSPSGGSCNFLDSSEADVSGITSSSKVKMENMEEILLKENSSAIETNSAQDETKDPLADTENVVSPVTSEKGDKGGGSDKEGDKEGKSISDGSGAHKRHADGSSDDESKKKKRKEDGTSGSKSKTSSISGGSPKSNLGNDSDTEDIVKNVESPGPKVPPLKIVLPSASTTSENDLNTGGRNGKSGTARHSALPYVVASDSTETSPSSPVNPTTPGSQESNVMSEGEKGGTTSGSTTSGIKQEPQLTEEQRTTQRILRSSHSRGSSSSSPAAPDASPCTQINTPPSSAVHSPEAPETTIIKYEEQQKQTTDEKPQIKEEPEVAINPVELHPRKRKLKHARESSINATSTTSTVSSTTAVTSTTTASINSSGITTTDPSSPSTQIQPPHEQQAFINCYQLYLNMRKQIDLKRKGLFPVKPITPNKFARYLMVTCDYVLDNNNSSRHNVSKFDPPSNLPLALKDLFTLQEQERYNLRMQHVVEKEKFALGVEQEVLRVHCQAARELANQPLPYSACTILKDEEVYNLLGSDVDDKDTMEHKKDKRADRYRYNGRLFIQWLRDIDDKWDKTKKKMMIRQTNEAESLHAVQKMDWEWKIKELSLDLPFQEFHVPIISIVDDLQSTDEQVTS